MAKALLFDLDGTLLHSDPLHIAVFIELFAEHGQQIDKAYYLEHIHGTFNEITFGRHFPDQDALALADEKEARFRDRLGDSAEPMPGLTALLDRAAAENWRVAVVTNAPRVNAEAMLAAIGMTDRLPVVIIGDECAAGKPDPAPYLAAMDRLGVAPGDCIAFEDSPSGMTAARASGAYCVGLRSSLTEDKLCAAGAHVTIQDYTDPALPKILARLNERNSSS
ncbi:MAG: HAD family phosphatase [Roseivivax sp.]|nr:HAD family phosphatase [Roseivivax sp.]